MNKSFFKIFAAMLAIASPIAVYAAYSGPSAAPTGNNTAGPLWLQSTVSTYQTGDYAFNGDAYFTPSKSIRVDQTGASTALNISNYHTGGTGFTLNVRGDLTISGFGSATTGTLRVPTICLNGVCRNSWPTAAGGTIGGNGSANYLPMFAGATTLANSSIYMAVGGNIGIGTTAPSATLSVNGGISATTGLVANRFSSPTIKGTRNYFTVYDALTATDAPTTDSWHRVLSFPSADVNYESNIVGTMTNNTAKLFYQSKESAWSSGWKEIIMANSAGNVGIGTNSPAYKVDVNGDVIANWLRSRGNAGWYNETYAGGWYMADASWIRTYNSKNTWTGAGLMGSDGGLTVGYGGLTPPTGGGIIAGTVGIGTSVPGAKLDVVAAAGTTAVRGATASAGGYGVTGINTAGSGGGTGVYGSCSGGNCSGIHGYTSGGGQGVYGEGSTGVYGNGSTGVYGNGSNHGVHGAGVYGVYGTGGPYGVYGTGGTYGVYGTAPTYGVYADSAIYGLYASGGNTAVTAQGGTYGVVANGTRAVVANGTQYGVMASGNYSFYGSSGEMYNAGVIRAAPNGAAYFCGGDDACLYDVNVGNMVGIYGAQNSTVGSLRLGSTGGEIHGYAGRIGIGITNPPTPFAVWNPSTVYQQAWLQSNDANCGYAASAYTDGNFYLNRWCGGASASAYLTPAGAWVQYSDKDLKEGIKTLSYGIDEVMKLKPVTYVRKDDKENKELVGFIAQDVQKVIPELVTGEAISEGGTGLGLNYQNLTAVLTSAIQDQQKEIEKLEKENVEFRIKNANLQKDVDALKVQLEAIALKISK